MIRVPIKEIAPILRLTVSNWQNDRAPRMGAALAYYMALSLAPTVVIILAVTSLAFGAKAAQGRLVGQIQGLVGKEGAIVIQSMIEGGRRSSTGAFATRFRPRNDVLRRHRRPERVAGCAEYNLEGPRGHRSRAARAASSTW